MSTYVKLTQRLIKQLLPSTRVEGTLLQAITEVILTKLQNISLGVFVQADIVLFYTKKQSIQVPLNSSLS